MTGRTNFGVLAAALASRTSSAIESLATDIGIPITEQYQSVTRKAKNSAVRRRPWHLRRVGTTGGKTYQPNGAREIARRLRQAAQIEAGGGRIARHRRERAEFMEMFDAWLMCGECGIFLADPPLHLCPCCEAYQEHRK